VSCEARLYKALRNCSFGIQSVSFFLVFSNGSENAFPCLLFSSGSEKLDCICLFEQKRESFSFSFIFDCLFLVFSSGSDLSTSSYFDWEGIVSLPSK